MAEYAAFGASLNRCRTAALPHLPAAGRALLVGEGDGRFLAALRAARPAVRVDVFDNSVAMLTRAREWVGADPAVEFLHGDAEHLVSDRRYDVVVTNFFLDQFDGTRLAGLVRTLAVAVSPGGCWAVADFRLPTQPAARRRAAFKLALIDLALLAAAGIRPAQLEDPSPLLRGEGFVLAADRRWQDGFLTVEVWRKVV